MSMRSMSRHGRSSTITGRGMEAAHGRSWLCTATVASVFLALLVPVNADASAASESRRTEPAQHSDAFRTSQARRTPYIRNTNRFQVVCCINFVELYTADFCPDNFNLVQ